MSHFTRIKTKMVDRESLIKALQDLGFEPIIQDQKISGFANQKVDVEIKISKRFSNDIGFKKVGDSYEIITDWWGVHGIKREVFIPQLVQRYAYHATKSKLEEQGFTLISEETEEKGKIRLVLRRTA